MKVVVTGATGNVGTSVVEALGETAEVERIVGLVRRRPAWEPSKTRWEDADILTADLASVFAGADAVIHLAWAIQPSHDLPTLERINVEGSRRVFDAVAEAAVPKLVYASSVGAYSPGPKDSKVAEDWPVEGIESSFYARHKALVEHMLDDLEARAPGTKVVRMRPALIFKGEAASEIRRLFVGPFLPSFLVRPNLIPLVPPCRGCASRRSTPPTSAAPTRWRRCATSAAPSTSPPSRRSGWTSWRRSSTRAPSPCGPRLSASSPT